MKKPFTHLDRDPDVRCSNPHCAEVRSFEGVARQLIKKNVIARAPKGQVKFTCYDCQMFEKTGMTRSERKAAEKKRKREKEEAAKMATLQKKAMDASTRKS
jgi:hypothetical protein